MHLIADNPVTDSALAGDSLQQLAERGHRVPEVPDHRQLLIGKYYRLIYRVKGDTVKIARIIHGRQDLPQTWKEH